MRQDAIIAVIVATICMLLYIWFRFKDIRFATSAVTAVSYTHLWKEDTEIKVHKNVWKKIDFNDLSVIMKQEVTQPYLSLIHIS